MLQPQQPLPSPFLYDVANLIDPSLSSTMLNQDAGEYGGESDAGDSDAGEYGRESDDGDNARKSDTWCNLIYQALMAAQAYRLVLRDIYDWIEHKVNKVKDPASKGWKSSIRSNLSRNTVSCELNSHIHYANDSQAFKKIPYGNTSGKSKREFIWVLEESMVGKGIKPTPRYRKSRSPMGREAKARANVVRKDAQQGLMTHYWVPEKGSN